MYKVTKQYGRGGHESLVGNYKSVAEAKAYVDSHIVEDVALKVHTYYRIYEFDEVIQTFDSSKIDIAKPASDSQEGGGKGKGTGATFSPTPFSSSPRPAGMPQNWKESEDKSKDEDSKK